MDKTDFKKCKKCGGKGKALKLDILKAKNEMVLCDACKGSGFERPKEITGFQKYREQGIAEWFCWYTHKQERAACMFCITTPVARRPGDPDAYLVISIHQMEYTEEKFKRRGYMAKILKGIQAMEGNLVKFIKTSFNDSTEEGRKFLMNKGFVKEGDTLIWRRDGKAEKKPTDIQKV